MLAQIADLRPCARMSLCPYVPVPFCLRTYVGFLFSIVLLYHSLPTNYFDIFKTDQWSSG